MERGSMLSWREAMCMSIFSSITTFLATYYYNTSSSCSTHSKKKINQKILEEKTETVSWSSENKNPKSRGLLILIRHGQSVWNRKPTLPDALWRYAGSIDIPLSAAGIEEALQAGAQLKTIPIDLIFSSDMDRARTTVSLAMSVHSSKRTPVRTSYSTLTTILNHHQIVLASHPLSPPRFDGIHDSNPMTFCIPTYVAPELKERNFGDLQGVPSTFHVNLFDMDKIRHIRNDFQVPFPGKSGESSKDVYNRVIPYFTKNILPHLAAGRNVLVSSHGFALRTLIKHLDDMDEREWDGQMSIEKSNPKKCKLLAPTGVPLMYQYQDGKFIKSRMSPTDRNNSLSRSSAAY